MITRNDNGYFEKSILFLIGSTLLLFVVPVVFDHGLVPADHGTGGIDGTVIMTSDPTILAYGNGQLEAISDRGNGSVDNPYVIENKTIDAGTTGSCIFIQGTDAHLVIQNCTLSGSGSLMFEDAAITIISCSNITVQENVFLNNGYNGVYLQQASFCNISSNNFTTGLKAMYLDTCLQCTVSGNRAFQHLYGLQVYYSHWNTVSGNSLAGGSGGCAIDFYHSDHNAIVNNTLVDGDGVVALRVSNYNDISGNVIADGFIGVDIVDSNSNNISRNDFINYPMTAVHVRNCDTTRIVNNQLTCSLNVFHFESIPAIRQIDVFMNYIPAYGVYFEGSQGITWDNGKVGNYWEFYPFTYPGATTSDNLTWNTPVPLYNNVYMEYDNHPLVHPELRASHPADIEYDHGATGNEITWLVADVIYQHLTCTVLHDGSPVPGRENQGITPGTEVVVDVDVLDVGIHNYTIILADGTGQACQDTVMVEVRNILPVITRPADVHYYFGDVQPPISWTITDASVAGPGHVIYRNGTELASGTWASGVAINQSIEGLAIGLHNFTIVASDGYNGSVVDTVMVHVLNRSLSIWHGAGILAFESNTTSNAINWTMTDTVLGMTNYTVFRNGTNIQNGTWAVDVPVIVDVGGLSLGWYNFTIRALDGINETAWDTILVCIFNVLPVISPGPDQVIILGMTNQSITWTINDTSTSMTFYSVTRDGGEIENGTWISGMPLRIVIDNMTCGVYNFTVTAQDGLGGTSQDWVIVRVDARPTITHPVNVSYRVTTTGHGIWWTVNDTDAIDRTYTITRGGVQVQAGYWFDDVPLNISIDGLPLGTFNYTITVHDGYGASTSNSVIVTVISDPKIYVSGNFDLYLASNSGNGTQNNPYIIEDRIIDAGGSGWAMYFEYTDAWLVVRNCTVLNCGTGSWNAGMGFVLCRNVNISFNTFLNDLYGITLRTQSDGLLVMNNTFDNCLIGVYVYNSNNARVVNNTIHASGGYGIIVYSYAYNNRLESNRITDSATGIALHENSENNTIIANEVHECSVQGVYIYRTRGNTVTRNIITNAGPRGAYGLELHEAPLNVVDDNEITGFYFGLYIDNQVPMTETGNTITRNVIKDTSFGMYMYYPYKETVASNHVVNSSGVGIHMQLSRDCHVVANDVWNNSAGLVSRWADNDTIAGNNFTRCTAAGTDPYWYPGTGVAIEYSDHVHVLQNAFVDNPAYGLYLNQDTNSEIVLNRFENNGFSGASCELSSGNAWNNSFAGNYWGDYASLHPNATTSDGVSWDVARAINGTADMDNHPLVTTGMAVSSPGDIDYYHDTTSNFIAWNIADTIRETIMYTVYRDGVEVPGSINRTWAMETIPVNVDGLLVGTYTYTLEARNASISINDSVIVTVLNVAPAFTHPADIQYVHEDTGHSISWTITDASIVNASCTVLLDGIPLPGQANKPWLSGASINASADGLFVGSARRRLPRRQPYLCDADQDGHQRALGPGRARQLAGAPPWWEPHHPHRGARKSRESAGFESLCKPGLTYRERGPSH